LFSILFNILTH